MKPQFQHQIITSFVLWLDHIILSRGEAYQNIESTFYHQYDERLDPDFMAFASPHKQWVTDSSIEGAEIIKGININDQFFEKNKHGIRYDFNNGRVVVPRTIARETDNVEGFYSVKDFNIYITDQTEEELLIETKFDKNSRFDQEVNGGVKPYDQVVPAIFCSYEQGYNTPFAFGGEDMTHSNIRCVVFAENSFQLDGVFSILKDLNHVVVSNVGFDEHPINELGDLKYGHYNYLDLSDRYYNVLNSQSVFHIDKITVSKLNDKVAKKAHPGLYIGFVDVGIISHRFPRAPLVEPVASRPPNIPQCPVAPFCLELAPQPCKAPECLTLAPQQALPPEMLTLYGEMKAPRNLSLQEDSKNLKCEKENQTDNKADDEVIVVNVDPPTFAHL